MPSHLQELHWALGAGEWGWELLPPAQGAAVALRASLTLTHSHTLTSAACALCCASPQPALSINEMPGTQGTAPSPAAATGIQRFGSQESPKKPKFAKPRCQQVQQPWQVAERDQPGPGRWGT